MDGEEQEAESIAMKVSAARFERQAQWKDFAILYRSNHQSRILEQALRNLKIPYTIAGGQSFFDKAEVRDILAYLRLLANDDDDPAFIRAATTPKRGIGQATLQTLGQYAASRELSLLAAVPETGLESLLAPRQIEPLRTFTEFIRRMQWRAGAADGKRDAPAEPAGPILDDLLQAIQYERHLFELFDEKPAQTRWQNVLELTGWLKRKAEEDNMSLFDLVQHVALVTMLERGEEEEPDAVKMSTLHASKGLEYPHVYLAGVEEGLLPHLGKDDEVGDPARAAENLATRIQEERRLMYVGITRAAQPEPELVQAPPPRPRGRGARAVALHRGNGPGRSRHQGRRDHRGDESEGTAGHAQGLAEEVDPEAPGRFRGCYGPAEPDPCSPGRCGRVVFLALGFAGGVGSLRAVVGWSPVRCFPAWGVTGGFSGRERARNYMTRGGFGVIPVVLPAAIRLFHSRHEGRRSIPSRTRHARHGAGSGADHRVPVRSPLSRGLSHRAGDAGRAAAELSRSQRAIGTGRRRLDAAG